MWYDINFNRLSIWMFSTFLRNQKLIAFAQALVFPLEKLHYQWKLKRHEDWYKLKHTGQVCKLRKVLNDKCDSALRRIEILPGNSFPRQYIYTRAENKTKFLGTFFIKSQTDYENTGVDFIVTVPLELRLEQEFKLIDYLEFYKLSGKRYKIEYIL